MMRSVHQERPRPADRPVVGARAAQVSGTAGAATAGGGRGSHGVEASAAGRPKRHLMTRFRSVRARSTLVAVLVVAVALSGGGLALVALVGNSVAEGVETTSQTQANDVASLLRLGQLPPQLPSGEGDIFTQVVASDGRVLATSASLLGTRPISHGDPGEDGRVLTDIPVLSDARAEGFHDEEGPYLLVSKTVATSGGPETVYVAGTLRPMTDATETLGIALAGGLPVFVLLVGLLVWVFAGRALRPVESIRAEVADISGDRDLHRRVPTPDSGDEVDRLARTMNAMLDRIEASSAAQRRFVADASHELRSPLAALQVTLEVAAAHPDRSIWSETTRDALAEARRLHSLVEDLLALARVEDVGAGPSPATPVDLDELVFAEAARLVALERVRLDLHAVSGGRACGDARQLTRVVRNLLANAARHATSSVSVELSVVGREVVLVVADDGGGIAAADRDRVFERFARLDEGRSRDEGGAGLGLAIVAEIVRAHGGSVSVADSRRGARLEVRLPAEEASPVDQ